MSEGLPWDWQSDPIVEAPAGAAVGPTGTMPAPPPQMDWDWQSDPVVSEGDRPGRKLAEAVNRKRALSEPTDFDVRRDYVAERIPLLGGFVVGKRLLKVRASAGRIQAGQASPDDYDQVAEFLVRNEQNADRGLGQQVFDLVTAIPGFAAEFAATGGAYGGGKAAAAAGIKKVAGELVEQGAGRLIAGAAARSVGVAAQAAANPQLVARSAAERALPEMTPTVDEQGNVVNVDIGEEKSFLAALPAAYLDTMIEVGSERAGGRLAQGVGALLGRVPGAARVKALKDAISASWIGAKPGRSAQMLKAVVEQAGWNGVIGEVLEERVGDVGRLATGLEQPQENVVGQVATGRFKEALDQLTVEGLAFSIPGAANLGAQAFLNRTDPAEAEEQPSQPQQAPQAQPTQPTGQVPPQAPPPVPNQPQAPPQAPPPGVTPQPPGTPPTQQGPPQKPPPRGPQLSPEMESLMADSWAQWVKSNRGGAQFIADIVAGGKVPSRRDWAKAGLPEGTTSELRTLAGKSIRDALAKLRIEEARQPLPQQPPQAPPPAEQPLTEQVPPPVPPVTGPGAVSQPLSQEPPNARQQEAGQEEGQGGQGLLKQPQPQPSPPNGPATPAPAPQPAPEQAIEAQSSLHPDMRKALEDLVRKGEMQQSELDEMSPRDLYPGVSSGKPTTLVAFHGKGRATKEEAYTEGTLGPVLGKGKYWAATERVAQRFGPQVERATVRLKNPYVLTSDKQLQVLLGQPVPYDNASRVPLMAKARQKLEAAGHDGVIVNLGSGDMDSAGDSNKRLREVFGQTQIVEFSPTEPTAEQPPPKKGLTKPQEPVDDGPSPGARAEFLRKRIATLENTLKAKMSTDQRGQVEKQLADARQELEALYAADEKPAPPAALAPKTLAEEDPETLRQKILENLQKKYGQGSAPAPTASTPAPTLAPTTPPASPAPPAAEPKKGLTKPRPADTQAAMDEAKEKARRLAELLRNRLSANPTTDPEIIIAAADMTVAYTKAGVLQFRDFIREVAQVLGPDLTRRAGQVLRDAWDFVRAEYPDAKLDASSEVEPLLEEKPPPTYGNRRKTADLQLAESVAEKLRQPLGQRNIDAVSFFNMADEAYGGTRAEGKYGPSEAYDALETGINQYLAGKTNPAVPADEAKQQVAQLDSLIDRVPSQTNRSGEKDLFQQFSTPPAYAYAANWIANITPSDTVLEPSAGVGGIAIHAANAGAKVHANEYSQRRAALLRTLPLAGVTTEDAEQAANILPQHMPRPTVVVMNPPFSHSAQRMGLKKIPGTDLKHVTAALNFLADGGRLVAIVGAPLHKDETSTFLRWIDSTKKAYNVRANLLLGRKVYRGYGTTFPTRVLVIDKTGPTSVEPMTGMVESLGDLIDQLEGVRNDRRPISTDQQQPVRPEGEEGPRRPGGLSGRGGAAGPVSGDLGTNQPDAQRPEPGVSNRPAGSGLADGGVGPGAGAGTADTAGQQGGLSPRGGLAGQRDTGGTGAKTDDGAGRKPPSEVPAVGTASGTGIKPVERIEVENRPQAPVEKKELTESVFEPYRPSKLHIPGAKTHPGSLVESTAMASVESPDVTYRPAIPKSIIEKGLLSDIQLEAVTYAGQAHQQMLAPDKDNVEARQGYMVGDGTGVGKGRIVSGIILDNWMQGRKRAVWVSKNIGLLPSAKRDWKGVGQSDSDIHEHGKVESGAPITLKEGILFTTYGTMRQEASTAAKAKGNVKSRVDQIADWLGPDFDGVIAFDESHEMAGAVPGASARGEKKPSLQGLAGLELQKKLPKARIVYVSATSATEVNNLAYADRLGLWGRGTQFNDVADFIAKIADGGVAAMELVARDLKALGSYLARSLSFNDGTPEGTVEYERLEHPLTKEQRAVYDKLAEAWQVTLNNFNEALELTGGEKNGRAASAAKSAFWSAHQRFFNQIITAMQLPAVLPAIQKDLDAGRSVVIQLTNTGEASQERALAGREEGEDLADFDAGPADVLIQMVEKSFPTQEYEEYVDENGKTRTRPVVDSKGNPVHNAAALAAKKRLLEQLGSIAVPHSPLDAVIDHFGHENVAEITGRGRRIILMENDKGQRVKTENKRSKAFSSQAEIGAFQQGKKRILLFSEAGGTGASYHADRSAPNQQKRVHYLLQAGWKAAAAIQGLGRTHRTNQAQAPTYILVHTDLKGQKRFLSTIARRLAQLGALTKGQRQTGSSGVFNASDNLEGTEAKDALRTFFRDLYGGRVEGITIAEFQAQTGLKLLDDDGMLRDDLPPIQQFLNRMLSLKVDLQNRVFEQFDQRLQAKVQQAEAEGKLDVGVETLAGDKIEKVVDEVAYVEPKSQAKTRYIKLKVSDRTKPRTWAEIQRAKPVEFIRNKNGKVFAVEESMATRTDDKTGAVHSQFRLVPAGGTPSYADVDRVRARDGYTEIPRDKAEAAWRESVAALPEFMSYDIHMIAGVILPIWNRIKGSTKVRRTITDKGEQILGRVVPSSQIAAVLRGLGVGEAGNQRPNLTPQQAVDLVGTGATLLLDNGWRIKESLVQREERIEIVGPDFTVQDNLVADGVFVERVGFKTRYFIPVGPKAADVMGKVLTRSSVAEVLGGKDTSAAGPGGPQSPGQPPARRRLTRKPVEYGDDIQPLTPGVPGGSSAAPFATDPAETDSGKELLESLKADAKSKANKAGIRSIVEYLNQKLGVLMLVSRTQTTKRNPAHYQRSVHIVRSRSGAWQVNFHEAGHAISNMLDDKRKGWRRGIGQELIDLTQMSDSMASAKSIEEGIAEFVRRFITDYDSLPQSLVSRMEPAIDAVDVSIMQYLRDSHRAYQFHRSRPVAEQMATLSGDKAPPPTSEQVIGNALTEFAYSLVGGSAVIHRIIRRAYQRIGGDTKFTGYDPTGFIGLARSFFDSQYAEQQKAAREAIAAIKDTPADIEAAYNSTVRVPEESLRALGGVAIGREGVRVLMHGDGLTEEQAIVLEMLGIEPKFAPHGDFLYLGDKSFARIRHDVGLDKWQEFVTYGQYRTALDRHQSRGQDYPGRMDGVTPNAIRQQLQKWEAENPEWKEHFKSVNAYMDQLLAVGYLSGEFTIDEITAMKEANEDYWPLPRQVEDRPGMSGGGGTEPTVGIRMAFGSSLPFASLDDAVDARTWAAMQAYYTSRMMKSMLAFSRSLGNNKDLPFIARKEQMQLMLPLRLEKKLAATVTPLEEAEIIADGINRDTMLKAGGDPQGMSPGAIRAWIEENVGERTIVEPEDVVVSTPSRRLWRLRKPNAVHLVSFFEKGERQYYQVPDPLLFDMFSGSQSPGKYMSWVSNLLAGIAAPWRRARTQNLAFAAANLLSRDTVQAMGMGEGAESLVPYLYAATAAVNRVKLAAGVKGAVEAAVAEGELLSRALDHTNRDAHRSIVDNFMSMLAEGIVVPGWNNMPLSRRAAAVPGVAMSAVLKPIDIFNWVSGGRLVSTFGEKLTREGAYLRALARGESEERAQLQYDRVTGTFGHKPGATSAAALVRTAGFLNPKLQIAWGHLQRLTNPDPQARAAYVGLKLPAIALIGAAAAATSYLLIRATYDDDEQEEILKRLRERRDEDRLRYMAVLGKLRLPFDYGPAGGVFSYGWNSAEEWLLEDPIAGEKKAKQLLVRVDDELAGAMPPLLVSAAETNIGAKGWSFFFDKEIVPGFLVDKFPYNPELRTLPDTPEFYNQTAQVLAKGGVPVSPLKIQYVVQQAFAREYDDAAEAVDRVAAGRGFEASDMPAVGSRFLREPRGRSSQSFLTVQDLDAEYRGLVATVKEAKQASPDDAKVAAVAERVLELEPAHQAMLEIERTWDLVRDAKRAGDDTKAAELERKMTSQAREFLARWGSDDESTKSAMRRESIKRIRDDRRAPPKRKLGESLEKFQGRRAQWESDQKVPELVLGAGGG